MGVILIELSDKHNLLNSNLTVEFEFAAHYNRQGHDTKIKDQWLCWHLNAGFIAFYVTRTCLR